MVREVKPAGIPGKDCWALMSTRRFANGFAALQGYQPRWHIKIDGYRELKEGFGQEKQL